MPLVRTTDYRATLAQRLSQSLKDPVALEHWRSSLVPASAVIPAPAVYFLVVAAKVPDVRLSLGQRPAACPAFWVMVRRRQPGMCHDHAVCYPSLFKPLCPTPPLHLIVWTPRGTSHPALAEAARTELKPALSKQASCVERFSSALCRLDGSLFGTCLSRTWSTSAPRGRWQASIDRGITGTGDADRTVL